MILIDCPPALGLLTVNGLVAADYALVSAEAQYFALQGVQGALEVDRAGQGVLQPRPRARRRADEHRRHAHGALARGLRGARQSTSANKVFKTVIRSSIAYAESAESAKSILDHRPDLGADYLALADELLKRVGLDAPRRKLRPLLAAAG